MLLIIDLLCQCHEFSAEIAGLCLTNMDPKLAKIPKKHELARSDVGRSIFFAGPTKHGDFDLQREK